jgi:hypothetical protein
VLIIHIRTGECQEAKVNNEGIFELVEPRNVTMYPIHWATVEAHAKDMGYPSVSAALRRIIDEWLQFKATQLSLPLATFEPAGITAG